MRRKEMPEQVGHDVLPKDPFDDGQWRAVVVAEDIGNFCSDIRGQRIQGNGPAA